MVQELNCIGSLEDTGFGSVVPELTWMRAQLVGWKALSKEQQQQLMAHNHTWRKKQWLPKTPTPAKTFTLLVRELVKQYWLFPHFILS